MEWQVFRFTIGSTLEHWISCVPFIVIHAIVDASTGLAVVWKPIAYLSWVSWRTTQKWVKSFLEALIINRKTKLTMFRIFFVLRYDRTSWHQSISQSLALLCQIGHKSACSLHSSLEVVENLLLKHFELSDPIVVVLTHHNRVGSIVFTAGPDMK